MKLLPAAGITREQMEQVLESDLFNRWAYGPRDFRFGDVTVNAVFAWQGAVRMIQMTTHHNGRQHAVFLREPTVDILTLVTDGIEQYVVFVDQARPAVGQIVRSNPAGAIDGGESPAMAALRERTEEVGSDIDWELAVPMHLAVLGVDVPLLVTPGTINEETTFFFVEGRTTPEALRGLHGRVGGLAAEGERTQLVLVPLNDAFMGLAQGQRRIDLKTVLSLLLYKEYMRFRDK